MNLLGKISLLLSVICLLLTLAFKIALTGSIPFIDYGLIFGFVFFIFALVINIKFLKNLVRSESLHFVGKSLVFFALTLVAVVLLNYINYKQNWTFDLTRNKIHSLPSLTKALVRAMDEDLNFYYFHVGNEKVRGFETQVRSALRPYMDLTPRVHLFSYNIFKRPSLAKRFKVGDEESSLFVEYKGRIQRVEELNESAITNSLLKLTKPPKKIYFVQSNDSRVLDDASTFGLNGLKIQMERLHYQVAALESLESIPKDAAILVMVGPRRPLSDQDQKYLEDYLSEGGAMLVAADPGEDHRLNSFLEKYGIKLNENFVFSSQAQASQSDLLVLTHGGRSNHHEVARNLPPGQNPALFVASTLEILDAPQGDSYKVEPVLEHLPNNLGRADIDKNSKVVSQGQQYAAAVSEGVTDHYYRLAVVGDSDFLTNQLYARPGNFAFALSLFAFLSKDEDLLKLKIPMADTTYLTLTQTQMNLYFLFFIVPFVGLFFILALFFKLRRLF